MWDHATYPSTFFVISVNGIARLFPPKGISLISGLAQIQARARMLSQQAHAELLRGRPHLRPPLRRPRRGLPALPRAGIGEEDRGIDGHHAQQRPPRRMAQAPSPGIWTQDLSNLCTTSVSITWEQSYVKGCVNLSRSKFFV